jgi:hypothetical protein
MHLVFDKIYAPLLLMTLIVFMKLTPWFYDIALGGTDRILTLIVAALFSIVKFVVRLIRKSSRSFHNDEERDVQFS